ncbi:MAG: galactokinase [Saprospiraceae bacterium]|nr:galactokinase [Saprospiraceae bacterium]
MELKEFLDKLPQDFENEKTIFYKAPGRINIIGEHTDYNGGLCLPAAIDKSIYFALTPSYETEIISLNEGNHYLLGQSKSPVDWAIYFKGVLDLLKEKAYQWPYFKLAFGGNLPSGAGLSSSSAITCGFISILNDFAELNLSKDKLTSLSVIAEKASGLDGGMMDQITILNAKKNHVLLINCDTWSIQYIQIPDSQTCWLVVDTKIKHKLVDTEYNARSKACEEIRIIARNLFGEIKSISQLNNFQQIEVCKHLSLQKQHFLNFVLSENIRVKSMVAALKNSDFTQAGKLLFEGHDGLRKWYLVSCDELDFLINYASHNSMAYGARMMGGGFGGSTLHLIEKSTKEKYIIGIKSAYKNRFGFEPNVFEAILETGVQKLNNNSKQVSLPILF